mgnify:CR=1 FL=1
MIKTPKFWTKKNVISISLLPLSFIYFLGFFLKDLFTKTHKISKPVICVGNLIAGGSGKTPTAIAIGEILHEMGVSFAFLSRGYMADESKFLMLRSEDNNKAQQVGDEPLLLVETATTFVSKDRLFGAKQIEAMNGYSAIVLDDGMQNNSLHRDLTIMVVDGKIGFGNDFLIPAGPKREPLFLGLKKVDFIVVIGKASCDLLSKFQDKKVIQANLIAKNIEVFENKKLLAFCGLAYPEKFFNFLKQKGLDVIEEKSFADHYNYEASDLKELCQKAEENKYSLITTKKDWIKFPKNFQDKISYLDVSLKLENKELVKNMLKKIL